MNYQEMDILQVLCEDPELRSQRMIAEKAGCSLGIANRTLRSFQEAGLLDAQYRPTEKALEDARRCRPERAVILAAGYGLRMIPINTEVPKGLLSVHGELLVERLIRQLHEAGVHEIYVVTGYKKEQYEYLADAYDIRLLACRDYMTKNNLYSLYAAKDCLANAYIVPCDLYFYKNPFHTCEFYSWYMVSREETMDAEIRVTRNREIIYVDGESAGNRIVGLAYLKKEDAAAVRERLIKATANRSNSRAFWELTVTEKSRMTLPARWMDAEDVVEINTYEQLRELDYYNAQLRNEITETIQTVLSVRYEDIRNIRYLKKGLTNHSFLFTVNGAQYIMRIPGWGTNYIDRKKEGRVYELIRGRNLCDENIYFNPENGFKISRYLPNAHICDEDNPAEVRQCLQLARKLHGMKLHLGEALDVFGAIQWYEDLWEGAPSQYRDYEETKAGCMALRNYVERHANPACLTHGDCKPDNFLFSVSRDGKESLQLIDWEYAFDCDPLFDVAGFIAYRPFDMDFTNLVINAYFPEGCSKENKLLLYAYCALWAMQTSNWCEHKMRQGVEVDEFAITCYRNAKLFCRLFNNISRSGKEEDARYE